MERNHKHPVRWYHGLITLLLLAGTMLYVAIGHGGGPLLPLIVGCVAASAVSAAVGYRWSEILEFMIGGIVPALEAILILLLIGGLIGVWILSGTVPSLIYYGLCALNARWFFAASALLCAIVSFALGAWGTVGTVGTALLGVGTALGLPLPMVAGSVVSGAYFGDALSPLSDATNLTAAVTGRDVLSIVKKRVVPIVSAFALGLLLFLLLGCVNAPSDSAVVTASTAPLKAALREFYCITPLCILPLAVLVGAVLLRIPAIPSILLGICAGAILALFGQHADVGALMSAITDGTVSETGVPLIDSLFSAGGIRSMLQTVSIILAAMAFGGVLQKSGQVRALILPLAERLKGPGALNGAAALLCVLSNLLLPDQYLGISVPGQMLLEEYKKRGYDRLNLSTALTAAALTSPLIPWNTCGLYCAALLGVRGGAYLPFAFFNLAGLLAVVLFGFLRAGRKTGAV